MKICVTGGAGFIGSHVAEAYLNSGAEVKVLDNLSSGRPENVPKGAELIQLDICDKKEIIKFFGKEQFDVVNHHAAQISVPDSVKNPIHDAETNILGLLNVLAAGLKTQIKKIIVISSGGTVYGNPEKYPCDESYPYAPANPYGITKAAGELYVKFYGTEHGLKWTILRYSNVYGPRQDPHGEAGVVAIFSTLVSKKQPVSIFGAKTPGDGGCIRDYVYVKDVARANVKALSRGTGEAFNIGTGKQTCTKDLINLMGKISGREIKINDKPPRPGDILTNSLNFAKAKKLLEWEPIISLEEGLRETYNFFNKNS